MGDGRPGVKLGTLRDGSFRKSEGQKVFYSKTQPQQWKMTKTPQRGELSADAGNCAKGYRGGEKNRPQEKTKRKEIRRNPGNGISDQGTSKQRRNLKSDRHSKNK